MEKQRKECIRCGRCCMNSSPTIHKTDIGPISRGFIPRNLLYTIRKGELVHDPVKGGLILAPTEMIKVRESSNTGACIFYEEESRSCSIYDHRPSQCAALKCWDTDDFMRVYASPMAERRDILTGDERLLSIVAEHNEKFSYTGIREIVGSIPAEGKTAVERLVRAIMLDLASRAGLERTLGVTREETDFLLGRPLQETIKMFGLECIAETRGNFTLKSISSQRA